MNVEILIFHFIVLLFLIFQFSEGCRGQQKGHHKVGVQGGGLKKIERESTRGCARGSARKSARRENKVATVSGTQPNGQRFS